MVFADIQHSGGIRMQAGSGFQLEAGEFQHIDFSAAIQSLKYRQADIACHHGALACGLAHLTHQGSHRALAIGTCDRNQLGRGRPMLGKQFHIPHHGHTARDGSLDLRLSQRYTWASHDNLGIREALLLNAPR